MSSIFRISLLWVALMLIHMETVNACASVDRFILFTDADNKSTKFVPLDSNSFAPITLFKHIGIQHPIAVDYDPVEDRVYWSDVALGRIISAFCDATTVKILFTCNVQSPDGLAIDYVGRNIYWTDAGTNRIEVGRLDGTGRKLLIKDELDEPRAIVLDERNGMMYWTDWSTNPKIEQAEMDGSARRTIVTGNLVKPNGLTIDQLTNRLFWVDAKLDKIEVSDLNGRNRQLIMSSAVNIHPYGLAVYRNMLYWTDWHTTSISRFNLSSGNQEIIVNSLQKPMDIHVFDQALIFSGSHNCSQNNGLCSDFCLLKPGGYQCACPSGIALQSDGRTCDHGMFYKTSSDKFLLFAEGDTGEIYKVPLEVPETPCYPLGINKNISRPVAVDYDPVEGKIYWTDVTLKLVARAFPNGSSVEVIAHSNVITPEGLAVDYIGRNIYWTDEANNRIEVARLDGSSRRSLITRDIEKPRAILLNIRESKMYWGGRGISRKIEQANMDGSARSTLVSSRLTWVNSLAMDYQNRLLYWCDGYLKKIERVDLQGNNRVVILDLSSDSMHPFGLALFDDVVYWSDWKSKSIHKYNVTTSVDEVVVHGMGQPMELHVHDQSKDFAGSTSCSQLNGDCSHLCLPNPYGHQCFCPEGVQLKPGDAFTCQGVNRCPQLTAPAQGSIAPCYNLPGHSCHFSCDSGHILTGSATRRCDSNGVWTGSRPQCNAVTCPALLIPLNGIHQGCTRTATEYNTVCRFSCTAGFNPVGSPLRRCLENRTWSGQDLLCQAVTCRPLNIPSRALLLNGYCGNTYGSNCVFGCQSGFVKADGNVTRTCLETGQWSGNPIRCIETSSTAKAVILEHTSSLAIAVGLSFAVTTSILVALLCTLKRHFLIRTWRRFMGRENVRGNNPGDEEREGNQNDVQQANDGFQNQYNQGGRCRRYTREEIVGVDNQACVDRDGNPNSVAGTEKIELHDIGRENIADYGQIDEVASDTGATAGRSTSAATCEGGEEQESHNHGVEAFPVVL